ncbi:type IV toxin-antitoxin system AbiEi family antitoxin domain-containing protein [Halosimplex rubrum]|uniref:Type IV toxin-antitoxin system AbiEi family antitoxin domain-containing protein n=1 Tax=Halosimplex rubrum TaxID=869889 RepID=A0A7D5P186_9EURY|nr:type IV toxin-antitoxin system AbiEi family antitoxin [Halosimplex rubrum]QLH78483.1 type IV toxin-antitoxin system AbiEi family antitoxin domain-containing protein [Halosimplex rubrum]
MGTESEEDIKSGLSKREALALTRLAGRNETIVTIDDIESVLGCSRTAAKKIASNLEDKKWLDRLKRGTYLIVPLAAGERGEYTEHEYVIASHLAEPMYLSYWTALNYHGLTEQVPTTVFAATTGRVPDREIHGVTYRFVTVTDGKFFGHEPVSIRSQTVDVAAREKALVDCADHPEHCGGIVELAKALDGAADLDTERLVDYVLRLGNGAAVKRIVYLADTLGVELPQRDELEAGFTSGYSKLDPTRGDDGTHSSEYRLLLNVSTDEIETAGGRFR